ncbi:MAG: hypothetical protein M1835_003442 [Candelina submexicana]|nr:MAG: hypothetical protein M1835_003442 [Candelina submexicana]
MEDGHEKAVVLDSSPQPSTSTEHKPPQRRIAYALAILRITITLTLLFLNYFLAQFDKFVLSYFQDSVVSTLHLSSSEYGLLSGYATGIVYALLAIPVAFIADYTKSRVWVLSIAGLWWSLCVVFQGLSHNFWQILLARIGMGIGQAPVEVLSVSLISDLLGTRWLFFGERALYQASSPASKCVTNTNVLIKLGNYSILYIGVYVGEAVSGQIATAFGKTNTPWNSALKAIGIVGIVIAILIRLLLREPSRRASLVDYDTETTKNALRNEKKSRWTTPKAHLSASLGYGLRMHSFWLLTLSARARQLSGNVFGYYMPSYLSSVYPSKTDLLSRYGIIVGVVGSVAVVLGGFISSTTSCWTIMTPLYLTAYGGMISSIFVILMVLSKDIAGGNQTQGIRVLYGVMSVAYSTAELWLGAFASLLVLLLPPRMKTFALAIYSCVIVLVYSSGPEIIGLALRNVDPDSGFYIQREKVILAVLIPMGYWIAGIGFLLSIGKVRRDVAADGIPVGQRLSSGRRVGFSTFAAVLGALVIALFVASIVFRT